MIAVRKRRWLWRAISIAVFCGLPLLLVGLVVSNALEATEAADQVAQKSATTSMILAQLEKHPARAATPVDTSALYLASASDSLARAEVQARVTKLVAQEGGWLAEVQFIATPEQEAAGIVAIQVALDIDNKGLLHLLYAIESGLPFLDVTDLSVQKNRAGPEDRKHGDDALHVDLTVQGHGRRSIE